MVFSGINLNDYESKAFGEKLKHCLAPYFRRDVCLYLINNRSYKDAVGFDKISALMRENDNHFTVENENKVVVVNLGWHDSDPEFDFEHQEEESIYKESEKFWEDNNTTFFFDYPFAFNKKFVMQGEHVSFDNQENHAMMTLIRHPEGYYVLYLLWDWMHVKEDEADGEIQYFNYWMDKLVKTACVEPIFFKKFCKQYGLDMKVLPKVEYSKSILDIANEKYPTDEDKQALWEEMISKVDMRTITDCMTSLVFRVRKNPVTKEMAHDYLMNWAKKKWPLYVLFGNELRLNTTVLQKPDDRIKAGIFEEILYKYPQYALTLRQFDTAEVLKNKIEYTDRKISIYWPNIKRGMKYTKFASELFKNDELDKDLSRIYQDKECEHQLYLSIHPMDYFTQSLSKSNWTSCHNAWDGCCSNACSSLMFDEASIICYACDGKDYTYNLNNKEFKWNSKIWRQTVSIGVYQNSAIFMREYPQSYSNGAFSNKVIEIVKNHIVETCGVENNWVTDTKKDESEQSYESNRAESRRFDSYYKLGDRCTHYNDIPSRKTTFIAPTNKTKSSYAKIVIGGKGYCPICGKVAYDKHYICHQNCGK